MKKHVIIGAGPSGLLCAHGLLERDDVVIVVPGEDINYDDDETIRNPLLWAKAAFRSNHSPQMFWNKQQSQRVIKYGQGEGIGGNSNVNAVLYTKGSLSIYDKYWPYQWNSEVMKK
jgi:hypothetical protein